MKAKKKTINQILVTEKVIVTPDFKRKKKTYKFGFFLSSFLVCVLLSSCIYAEYDRSKSEEVSQDILLGIQLDNEKDNTTISVEEGVIIINALADGSGKEQKIETTGNEIQGIKENPKVVESVASDGTSYYTESILKIPSLGIEYPVLSNWSDELLKKSLNKLHGPNPNEVGNYVVIGHNYRGGKMFGKLPNIKIGDTVELNDLKGNTVTYKVYDKYIVEDDDVSCTSQLTNGKTEITLITCTNTGKQRHVIKAEKI